MTKYIKDKGIVRLCDSNVAKMNIFEVMYYYRRFVIKDFIELISEIKEIIIPILFFSLLPIVYPIMAMKRISQAKKEVRRCNDLNGT